MNTRQIDEAAMELACRAVAETIRSEWALPEMDDENWLLFIDSKEGFEMKKRAKIGITAYLSAAKATHQRNRI